MKPQLNKSMTNTVIKRWDQLYSYVHIIHYLVRQCNSHRCFTNVKTACQFDTFKWYFNHPHLIKTYH